eukprot:gene24310-32746_t
MLIRSGFKPWPLQDLVGSLYVHIGSQKKRFLIPGFDSSVNSRKQAEIDCVVSGDLRAWDSRSECIFVEKIKKKKSKKSSNENDGYVADEEYWLLLDSSTKYEHKILFVNGGEE